MLLWMMWLGFKVQLQKSGTIIRLGYICHVNYFSSSIKNSVLSVTENGDRVQLQLGNWMLAETSYHIHWIFAQAGITSVTIVQICMLNREMPSSKMTEWLVMPSNSVICFKLSFGIILPNSWHKDVASASMFKINLFRILHTSIPTLHESTSPNTLLLYDASIRPNWTGFKNL